MFKKLLLLSLIATPNHVICSEAKKEEQDKIDFFFADPVDKKNMKCIVEKNSQDKVDVIDRATAPSYTIDAKTEKSMNSNIDIVSDNIAYFLMILLTNPRVDILLDKVQDLVDKLVTKTEQEQKQFLQSLQEKIELSVNNKINEKKGTFAISVRQNSEKRINQTASICYNIASLTCAHHAKECAHAAKIFDKRNN